MIYVCIPSYNEAPTAGLLLWKVRQVFATFPREYQLLILDDGSTDNTREILEPYTRVLPLTVLRHGIRQGYAASIEYLLRNAVDRTDRPKRDAAILLHADLTHDTRAIPDLVRRIEGGADVVVAEGRFQGEPSLRNRLVRRLAPVVLRRSVVVAGVRDLVSGFAAFRLVTLRNTFRNHEAPLLTTDGWAANAELIGRAAHHARRIETVSCVERYDLHQRARRATAGERLGALLRARRHLRVPPAPAQTAATPAPTVRREAERAAS